MPDESAFVLLITGPAGAGKSAAAEMWAARQTRPSAHIRLDEVREFVRSGYADPQGGWTLKTARQLGIARANCGDMARRYVAAGFNCAIDDAIFPQWGAADYAGWQEALGDIPHVVVVLLPTYEVIAERNARRHGRRLLAPAMLRAIYDMMTPWSQQRRFPTIDTSALTVEETASAIEHAIERMRRQGNSG